MVYGPCGAVTDSATVNVIDTYNATIATPSSLCVNSPAINLNAQAQGGVWSGPGIVDGTAGIFDPSVSGVGVHEINYIIYGLCGSSDTALITVLGIPTADFTISPSTISPTIPVNFTNTSTGSVSWGWNFGDTSSTANTSSVESPMHVYTKAGTYCILLTATNSDGCFDTINYCLSVTDESSVKVPNVFTPNGDGNNDIFYFECLGVKNLKCLIFDRWGVKIIEMNGVGQTNGWNGEDKNGKAVLDGTYFYIIEATGLNNTIIKQQGFVQLIREKMNHLKYV